MDFLLRHVKCPYCSSECSVEGDQVVCELSHSFPIREGVPEFLLPQDRPVMNRTSRLYGKLWYQDFDKFRKKLPSVWHYHEMQKVIPKNIVREGVGLEVGCGNGYDTYLMAKAHPKTQFVSFDLSEGVFFAKKITAPLNNVHLCRASASHMPFKDHSFDFAYSFGVLHHLPNPNAGFKEMIRILKPGAPYTLYLYESHKDNFLKYWGIKLVSLLRSFSRYIHPSMLKIAATATSPFIVVTFSWPAKALSKFETTKELAKKIPFNFGTGLFSVKGDLYDRFGAPYEHRFDKGWLKSWHDLAGCDAPYYTKLERSAGWVTMGAKCRPSG